MICLKLKLALYIWHLILKFPFDMNSKFLLKIKIDYENVSHFIRES